MDSEKPYKMQHPDELFGYTRLMPKDTGLNQVIFLDFDGVVSVLETGWKLSDRHLQRVKRICDETGAKIVISSSWRCKNVVKKKKNIYGRDVNVATCNFLLNINYVIDVSERLGPSSRGKEIKKWLDEHPGIEKYVILDDDDFDMLPEQKPFLIQTDWAGGIEDDDVEKAIEILTK